MLCSLAREASWVVFPETISPKAGASMCEERQILAALLKPGCGFCAELDWEGMSELGGTPVSCSEDLRGLQIFLLSSFFVQLTLARLLANILWRVVSVVNWGWEGGALTYTTVFPYLFLQCRLS